MSKGSGPWDEGRKAWKRLAHWDEHGLSADDREATGDAAISALTDISTIRRLLERAEFTAVRRARRGGKSWAEIATMLGVTRQSAWERWRDVDDGDHGSSDERQEVLAAVAGELTAEVREKRRRSSVVVPRVIGMRWDDALVLLHQNSLVGVRTDPDGPPLASLGWPNTVVTDQSPEAGAKVPAASPVTLWLEPGDGSAGDREPRRPKPTPLRFAG